MFKTKQGFPFDLLCDTDLAMSVAYGVCDSGAPRTGRMSMLIDPDGKVHKTYSKVSPATHPEEVLADIG